VERVVLRRHLDCFMSKRRCTLLGVGAVSKNCVDAAIELANEYEFPLMLIASRRQIESQHLGGGYVHRWSTEEFTKYVNQKDKKGNIILSRDHGGPWQGSGEKEKDFSLKKAMQTAKDSFKVDIDSGFQILHIDSCCDIWGNPDLDEILLRLFDLYEFCCSYAKERNKEILFEIGTEEQNGGIGSLSDIENVLTEVVKFCAQQHYPLPTFLVAQTGTQVKEMRNVGSLDTPFRIAYELPAEIQVPNILDLCNQHGVMLKQHNTDYLSDESLKWLPKLGIHAANVAPEYGVVETRALMQLLKKNGLDCEYDQFVDLAYKSGKWKKWLLPESKTTKIEKAMISGHYIFANPKIVEIKRIVNEKLTNQGILVDDYLKGWVKKSIFKYIKHFRLLKIH